MITEKEVITRWSLRGNNTPAQSKTIETSAGTLILQNFCSPSLIEGLRVDSGLCAFAHTAEREHHLLLSIARQSDSALTLAYTPTGEIVGQATLATCDEWMQGIPNVYEIAVEVSSQWRRLGVAQQLLTSALELNVLEDLILLAIGLSWHWDVEGLSMASYRYRQLIARLFARHCFMEYLTTEPNICMDPANILLARIGNRVSQQTIGQFVNRLVNSPGL